VHYYTHGAIGPFVVKEPMILGHEAAGEIVEVGSAVTELKPGDRVCMEPGIPDPTSRATRLGKYNLDPAVRFWATPPVHGVLRPTVAVLRGSTEAWILPILVRSQATRTDSGRPSSSMRFRAEMAMATSVARR
jgi:threonine dehydrogenase-like Zn-dependent dehydrogenase